VYLYPFHYVLAKIRCPCGRLFNQLPTATEGGTGTGAGGHNVTSKNIGRRMPGTRRERSELLYYKGGMLENNGQSENLMPLRRIHYMRGRLHEKTIMKHETNCEGMRCKCVQMIGDAVRQRKE
jgi:hypothetical protein